MATDRGWVRVGTDTTWRMLAIGVGLALLGAIGIAAPVSELVLLTSGSKPGWLPTAIVTFLVLAVAIAVPLVLLSNRPASINLDAGLVRVGWRTVPIAQLRHAYRMPGGATPDQFVLQLELDRAPDARLPVRSAGLPNLSLAELEVLLELLRRAPLEPNTDFPLRSPIAGELGDRSDSERIADEVSDALQPFGRVSYAKPTLLLEVEDAIERARRAGAHPAPTEPLPSERRRLAGAETAAGAETTGTTVAAANAEPVPAQAREASTRPRREVEEWIAGQGAAVSRHAPSRVLGWAIIVAALVLPWILTAAMLRGGLSMGATDLMAWWGASILTWPFFVWLGVVFLKRARALRHASARRASLAVRSRGVEVPGFVRDAFASTRLERSYGVHVYLFGIVLSLAFLVAGLLLLALSADMVGGPYSPLAWHAPVGWLLLVPVIPVFAGVLRWQRFMSGQLARAQVEWRLLGNSSV